jgi:hypothetical protein
VYLPDIEIDAFRRFKSESFFFFFQYDRCILPKIFYQVNGLSVREVGQNVTLIMHLSLENMQEFEIKIGITWHEIRNFWLSKLDILVYV